jgi:hypothetical protein|tara:strand:- start:1821 stop:2129 length:309 start_codon:yes stop_codon:yes gene_type:complete
MTVKITQYKWAGKLGPFRIKTKCENCDLTTATLKNMMQKEFKDKDIVFEVKPWLDHVFYCIFRLSWHAPIIIVNGRKFWQFSHKNPIFNKEKLEQIILKKVK